ncbi:peptidase A22B family protein [Cavenderia fasciculata]|uniref:Peptidase A22B family protein n=1 Tax=Cavenderia fasciculata TaxID=261658 RepID=F4Q6M6_CACFS|nr:peptidase A22B family protein [Cavenderia fasciculata]EGG16536.1 peptidase A22B family protein [Cavenderia fasciculata]|eukprot:XP_004354936.1 peptidase A22B family protein [Cavenderia fasciculata]
MAIELSTGLMVAYGAIWTMAIIPIYIGSYMSLKDTKAETMKKSDAWTFPLIGSVFLFGLYLAFKYFDKDLINLIMVYYFIIFGLFALSQMTALAIRWILGVQAPVTPSSTTTSSSSKKNNKKPAGAILDFHIPAIPYIVERTRVTVDIYDLVGFVIALGISYWYMTTKHWIANNIFGLTFSIQGISLIGLHDYSVGVILLSGLFLYDIFWVFGTDVMVTVAKSFDAPIKLLFPKDIFASTYQFTMLGLGDIVMPGIFIALLLKFDRSLASSDKTMKTTYFTSNLISYALGLMTTIFVMHTFQAAQPALLYLVPYCIGGSLIVALAKGQFKKLISFSADANKPKVK